MRHNPKHAVTDERVVRRLIAENPWATIVSQNDGQLVASHYPVLLDEEADGLTVVTHVGRPDERVHGLGSGEVLLIVAGPHGYVSPSWYTENDTPAPTWNFTVAHCYGMPQILDFEENLRVLTRLVDHFERHVDEPVPLDQDVGARISRGTVGLRLPIERFVCKVKMSQDVGARISRGTVGLRLPIERFVCKVKMSQDKEERTRRQVLEELRGSGPYAHPALAADMERALGEAS